MISGARSRTVRRSSSLPIAASVAWELVQQPTTFLFVVRGVIAMPAMRRHGDSFAVGQSGSGWLFLFHVVPMYRHTIEVVGIDPATMTVRTNERGGLLRRWDHTLSVAATGDRSCAYSDQIVIDAGVLTPVAARFAQLLFRYRHRRWRDLAALYS